MDNRTHASPMDWDYDNSQGPMDPTSPFTTFRPNSSAGSLFGTPSKSAFSSRPNPFSTATPSRAQSLFSPQVQRTHTAKPFLNPSFTTPRKPFDESILSEMSGAETSPAVTDASEIPADTPDPDRMDDFNNMAISPSKRRPFYFGRSPPIPSRSHASGKGEVPRGKYGHLDKVRKRQRRNDDRDVGTVRMRLDDSDISGSESDDTDAAPRSSLHRSKGTRRKRASQGWLSNWLSAIQSNPNAPDILVRWLQFVLQGVILSLVGWGIWAVVGSLRADLRMAADQARSERLGNITECARNYVENRCSPREDRLPRLAEICDEWEICMNQDPMDVAAISVGVKQLANILNEFVADLHFKTIGVLFGLLITAVMATRYAGDRRPDPIFADSRKTSQPHGAGPPFASADPNQAYIWAPLPTPHRLKGRRQYDEGTDTDASPPIFKRIMSPPETPSGRRSPSKEKRHHSPVKGRSTSRDY